MNERERFLAACRLQPVDRPPVWIMRQAGRYLPEYLELRSQHSFSEVCRTPELAREVVLQPLRRFSLDAAILFSDILVVPEVMGQSVDFPEGGPKLSPCVRDAESLKAIFEPDVEVALKFVADALDAIRDGIGPDKAMIGFSGAPYTLAVYMVEGGGSKHFQHIKKMAFGNPELLEELLNKLTRIVTQYLRMQIAHGADVVQLFDTWAGELAPVDFRRFVLPYVQRVAEGIADLNVPLIYFVNGVGAHLEDIAQSGAQVLGVDWRTSLTEARRRVGDGFALQGNLDPIELFGPEARIRQRVCELYTELGGNGHILNLGHGVLPKTPIENVAAFVDEITKLGDSA